MTDLYQIGETIRIAATITDSAGAAADPTTVVISIQIPAGTLGVTNAAMTKSAVGSYYYDYLIAGGAGNYKVQIKATGSGSRVTIKPDNFQAEAAI